MNRNEKLSDHFTFRELIRSETAGRKSINNTPPDYLISKLKRLCVKILEPVRLHILRVREVWSMV